MRCLPPFPLCWLALLLCGGGCRDSSVVTYRIPKENDLPATASRPAERPTPTDAAPAAPRLATAGGGDLQWTAPASWKSKQGSSMRKGTYVIEGDDAKTAELAISAFPGDVGGDLANVNRWRGQLGLPAVGAEELPALLTHLDGGALPMTLVDLASGPQRLIAAIVPFNGATWFFKLLGPDALVARSKSEFVAFLRTVHAPDGAVASTPPAVAAPVAAPAPAADMAATEVIKAEGPGLRWVAPPGWQSRPTSAMRKASYAITAADGTTLDLSITAFPGDVGGEAANVNRWRGQLQLPPLAPAEISAAVVHRDVHGLQLTYVDFHGGSQRLLGAIVPSAGATWFFKLMGPESAIASEEPAFVAFLNTLQAP